LQSFEVNFTYLANLLVDVIAALDSDDAESAAKHLLDGAETLDRALPLFSLLATMQRNSFTVFLSWPRGRGGASAIQSVSYKSFEAICGTASRDRVDSAAFRSMRARCARPRSGRHPGRPGLR
jgi:tryptophan 2,3-dioxygenase